MLKPFGTIYIIRNKENGKTYVGQTVQPVSKRWKTHKKGIFNTLISKVLRNNLESFEFIEFLTCFSKEELNFFEKHFIKEFNSISPNGYNLTTGGNDFSFTKEVKLKMKLAKLGKKSKNHIVKILAHNVQTKETIEFNSFTEASNSLNVSRSSILKSCKYGIIRKNYQFFYANQSGSSKNKSLEHAQRLESEPTKVEYNLSTSPQFPKKYMDQKDLILNLSQFETPHSISKKLNLDKSMLCYFIHCFGK
jgi:predicted GIY-YIG superfamily endonuclease